MTIDYLERTAELDGIERRFRIYVPPGYEEGVACPAVLFLHGAGERGSDGLAPTKVGIGPALERRKEPYPAIVVFPQCPAEGTWSSLESRAIAVVALAEAAGEFTIDESRIALTGISMGGAGAWLLAVDMPEKFVSLAPVCGWMTSRDRDRAARRIAKIPTWIVHGDADTIVPVDGSRAMCAALQRAGANVRYDELRGVGHNSWDHAYQKTGLMDWLIEPVSDTR